METLFAQQHAEEEPSLHGRFEFELPELEASVAKPNYPRKWFNEGAINIKWLDHARLAFFVCALFLLLFLRQPRQPLLCS